MNIIALDLSLTGTGVAYGGGVCTISSKLKDEARLNAITYQIWNEYTQYADMVIIEGLAFASQTGKVAERGALHYMVRCKLFAEEIPFAIAPPTTVKKYLTGKGNAGKDEMMIAGARVFESVKNNNENDAMAMYAMACDYYGNPIIDVPKLNRTALDKVEWPNGLRTTSN